jgi:hypothetical protein
VCIWGVDVKKKKILYNITELTAAISGRPLIEGVDVFEVAIRCVFPLGEDADGGAEGVVGGGGVIGCDCVFSWHGVCIRGRIPGLRCWCHAMCEGHYYRWKRRQCLQGRVNGRYVSVGIC